MQQYNNPTHAFEQLCYAINNNEVSQNGTKLVFNSCFIINDPLSKTITTKQRKFNEQYATTEWEWYLTGGRNANEISEIAKIWKSMFVPGTNGEVNSNYGYFWKLNNQLENAIAILNKDNNSRRAIVLHYDIHELDRYEYDTPCNVCLNFYIDRGKLCMTIFARSIDLIYGFCNDQYTFAILQKYVSDKLGKSVGYSCWMITNLHVYERHFNMIDDISKTTKL
jgi:thymidylate synthase